MTWEIAVGFFTIISAFAAAIRVVMKVDKTLICLDESVRQLKKFIEKQSKKNEDFGKILSQHEIRLTLLEESRKEEEK